MKIVAAKHIKDYELNILFDNKKSKTVDLSKFVKSSNNPMTSKFKKINLFKKVKVEFGHLSWGDSEMDLSASSIYNWKN